MRHALGALAVLFLAAHLATLPSTLEDLDSINFALGVRDFDVARHQPHPPGYPVFIGLAKLSTRAFESAGDGGAAARGLAFWSAVFGAVLVPALFLLFRALDGSPRRAWWATLLTVASPLVWFSAFRPLSDVTGLAAAVVAQALLVRAVMGPPAPGILLAGAATAGLAIGIRSQTFLLTLPLLGIALPLLRGDGAWRARAGAAAAFLAGVLVWAIPLVVASGGLAGYLVALGQQGGEDFSGVVMLWNFPTPRVALSALQHTFLSPWASIPLAVIVLTAALAGIVVVARRGRLALVVAALAVPYAIFHLLFHETVTVRYALPLIPVIAWLAVRGIDRLASRALPAIVVVAAAWSLFVAVPAGLGFAASPAPIVRALGDLSSARKDHEVIAASHRRIFTESRRARIWQPAEAGAWLDAPRDFEWLQLTRAWRSGSAAEAWFFADPRRTDLALIDAEGSRRMQYRWPFDGTAFVGGARPDEFDAHVYTSPGWFLDEGWAVTPEVAGITAREGWEPHRRPATGWVRRRPGEVEMTLGGRHLGAASDPAVHLTATIDGRPILDRDVRPGFFLEHFTLPAGALTGDGAYAALEVRASSASGPAAPVSLEQFNLQPAGIAMTAFADGWQEPEYNPGTGRMWRWMSERAVLWVRPIGRDVTLRLVAESPMRYFDRAPALRVSIGGQVIAQRSPSEDFTWEITLPAAALAAHRGEVVIESDLWFAPGGSSGQGDQRHLAVRVYAVEGH